MTLTTWYFEMHSPAAPAAAAVPAEPLEVVRAEVPSPAFGRFLYGAVGGDWNWTDRLVWSEEAWREYLGREGVETWVGYVRGTPAGYAELDGSHPGEVELAYFGLLPGFVGRGLGGALLGAAVERAWTLGERWPGLGAPARVWGHTCSDDSPAALGNYTARGFRVYRTETAG